MRREPVGAFILCDVFYTEAEEGIRISPLGCDYGLSAVVFSGGGGGSVTVSVTAMSGTEV